ncbi:MAG: ABC transporter ATP-binding protein/permease [Bacteroidales bacterium]|nr:ABC transporter ATP-binding protein/permease [Bacteroidales bacterium]
MKYNNLFARFVKPYLGRMVVVFLFNVLSVSASILVFMMIEPFTKILFQGSLENLSPISSFVVDHLSRFFSFDNSSHSVLILVVFVLLLYLCKTLFYYLSQWVMAHVRSHVIATMRSNIYSKILSLSVGNLSHQRRGDIVSRAVSDTQEVEFTILTAIRQLLTEPITLIIYLVILFYISVPLSLTTLLFLPVSFVLIGLATSPLRANARTSKQRLGSLLSFVEETIGGLRVVKGLNAFTEVDDRFHSLNRQFTKTQKKIYRQVDMASPLSEFFGVVAVMVVLVVGGVMALNPANPLTPPLFITYIAMVSQLVPPVKNLSTGLANFKRGRSALDRVDEILNADEMVKESPVAIPATDFKSSISFQDVSFNYGDKDVITHINFTLPKGRFIALVGESGSGKSTMADLLMRFYDPSSGKILLDGRDVKDFTLASYHSLFGFVSQDVVLFNDTLYNNLTLGIENVSEESIEEALRIADIYDFVHELPGGLQYNLTDRGLNLSGGQRQRISIARAVLRKAPILVLDEATSAMDTQSEQSFMKALNNLKQDHTMLVIAHRLSTIRQADCIYVMENGNFVQEGTHDFLKDLDGKYKMLLTINELR